MDDEVISLVEASRRFSIGDKTLQKLIRAGSLPVLPGNSKRLQMRSGDVRRAVEHITGGLPVEAPEMGELHTLYDIGRKLERGHTLMSKWVQRGWLTPVARQANNWTVKLFRFEEALEVHNRVGRNTCYGDRAKGTTGGARPLDANPTDSVPGSEERIRVYEDRAKRRVAIFHPNDRRMG